MVAAVLNFFSEKIFFCSLVVLGFFILIFVIHSAPSPANGPAIRRQWIENIQSHQDFDANVTNIGLCELHFDPKHIIEQRTRKILKVGTVPTIFPVTSVRLRHTQPKPDETTKW